MSKGLNYARQSSIAKGWSGFSSTPYYHSAISKATDKQISYVKALIRQLESAGVDVTPAIKDGVPDTVNGINMALSKLRELMKLNGIKRIDPMFVNICKDKKTGKKIQYRTSKRYHAPVGYEFLYEIRTEFVCVLLPTRE